ncbi:MULTISPECIES: hypothetical protein [Microbacterium]|uniref:Uncharacterized protein n=1 Tax=Microbacterium hominis TaxID=162426 RepID=A0A2K9D727_9MICO|nr:MULTISPECIES: hypothetical protein [Microbacterium]AUG29415.1 hypothetical protein CXR34_08045 [Microbacterium hominis]EPD84103.1 hypothetical protein HMPREF1529_02143 [Microbacterium sp. oral taxon 186 str. F0373]
MNGYETTIEVAKTEAHDRVAIAIGTHVVAYRPYDALRISGDLLDAVEGCTVDELTPITFAGHLRIGVTAENARTIARAIATTADQLLDEAEYEF